MALIDVMSGGNSFRKVSVDEIRPNRENFYASISENEDQMVEDMAELIQKYGQDENGVVYMDESVGDGKKYGDKEVVSIMNFNDTRTTSIVIKL